MAATNTSMLLYQPSLDDPEFKWATLSFRNFTEFATESGGSVSFQFQGDLLVNLLSNISYRNRSTFYRFIRLATRRSE